MIGALVNFVLISFFFSQSILFFDREVVMVTPSFAIDVVEENLDFKNPNIVTSLHSYIAYFASPIYFDINDFIRTKSRFVKRGGLKFSNDFTVSEFIDPIELRIQSNPSVLILMLLAGVAPSF